ncbi:HAD hydrolase-like protein [Acetobacterium wieringae]|uniref:HAD hydrolase-like protein n=1 Tax=Acetobacterium wieringae TaxID=52694 RepID=UPI0026EF5C7D|nr:HAD hydrolase-like protein [Acetobacterium wieringae]
MNYSHILFDLDGTLIDSKDTIRRSMEYALKKMNVPNPEISNIEPLIGPPMLKTLQEVYGFSLAEARIGYDFYLEEYVGNGQMYQAQLYHGVKETIQTLHQKGLFLGVATTKNETNARKIVESLKLDISVSRVYGTYNDGTRSNKKEIITSLLEDNGVTDFANALMVGDRHFDIIGAREVGIDSVGVTYGCGSDEELRQAGATHLASSIIELLEIVNI